MRVGGEGVRRQNHGAASLEAGNTVDREVDAGMGPGAPETCGCGLKVRPPGDGSLSSRARGHNVASLGSL